MIGSGAKVLVGGAAVILGALPAILAATWLGAADDRLTALEAVHDEAPRVATASVANEAYCTPELQRVLRRVLQSCGLLDATGGRGCQPLEAKNVATMSGDDFNALFLPMAGRAGIVQFDKDSSALDPRDEALVDELFADRRGASYFFVVSRASPEGATEHNRDLSKERAEAVMAHLRARFQDPELEKQVGLLWLGEEYAQLDEARFCTWKRSGGADDGCTPADLNRSAFLAWIDCQL